MLEEEYASRDETLKQANDSFCKPWEQSTWCSDGNENASEELRIMKSTYYVQASSPCTR